MRICFILIRFVYKISLLFFSVAAHRNFTHREHKATSLDDLPKPCGDWKKHNTIRQRKNNNALAFGIFFTVFTIIFGHSVGVFDMNYYPPERPADRDT